MKTTKWLIPMFCLAFTGCATRTRSLLLGGASGVALGGLTGALASPGSSGNDRGQNSAIGAGVGLGLGLLSAYLLQNDQESRFDAIGADQDERLRFGDLPPNPFDPANQRFLESRKIKATK